MENVIHRIVVLSPIDGKADRYECMLYIANRITPPNFPVHTDHLMSRADAKDLVRV